MIYTDTIPERPVGCTLRAAIISDVHMENRKTPTSHIVDNLIHYLVNPEVFKQIDVLFISGDFWDRLVNLPAPGVWEVSEFVVRTLRLAATYNVAIRCLEGTRKHDWKQSVMFVKENEKLGNIADCLYIDTLCIHDDEKLGMTIGYIPDQWKDNVRDTELEFKELMKTRGLNEVHFMIMHGFFDFQLPRTDSGSGFDSDYFNSIVRYSVYIGHDHNAKDKDKIHIPGSFERTRHGENGPRGFMIADIVAGEITNYRIENTRAMPYVTHDLTELSDEDILTVLPEFLKLGQIGYLKLRLSSKTGLRSQVPSWAKLTTASLEVEYLTSEDVEVIDQHFTVDESAPVISPDNIKSIILAEQVPDAVEVPVLLSEINYLIEQTGSV